MGWNDVDDKMKRRGDGLFVSCEESYERAYIKRAVQEEFPHFSEADIDAAIAHCCRAVPAPRPRARYLECLRRRLGE